MKRRGCRVCLVFLALFLLPLISFAMETDEETEGRFNPVSGIYINQDAGLEVTFSKGWRIYTQDKKISKAMGWDVDSLENDNMIDVALFGCLIPEMIFAAIYIESSIMLTDVSATEYAKMIMGINKDEFESSNTKLLSKNERVLDGKECLEMQYIANPPGAKNIHFQEIFFINGSYGCRIRLWCPKGSFSKNEDLMEAVAGSIEFAK